MKANRTYKTIRFLMRTLRKIFYNRYTIKGIVGMLAGFPTVVFGCVYGDAMGILAWGIFSLGMLMTGLGLSCIEKALNRQESWMTTLYDMTFEDMTL